MIRRLAATLAAVALLLALAAPVLAGGWAEIMADAQTVEPPVEGKPTVVGFRVLQHGETPAPWETATVHFTNTSTGETLDVVATNDREDGHFTATATLRVFRRTAMSLRLTNTIPRPSAPMPRDGRVGDRLSAYFNGDTFGSI